MKHCIGDISVHRGEPPEGNPYRKESLCGPERANALHDFHERKPTPDYTFWVAPCHGGAKRATWDDVNWETGHPRGIRSLGRETCLAMDNHSHG